MAEKIDLGELELTITANTKGLRQISQRISALRTDLKKDMDAMVSSMRSMEKGFKAIGTGAQQSSSKVAQAQKATTSALSGTQKALNAAALKYNTLKTSVNASNLADSAKASQLRSLKDQYVRYIKNIKAASGDLEKITKSTTRFKAATALTTRNLKLQGAALRKTAAKKSSEEVKALAISTTDLSKAVQVALGPLSGVASRITAMSALANKNTLAIAAMTGGLIAFGAVAYKTIKLASEYQKQMRQLDNRVKIFGDRIGVTTEELDAMAISLGERTLAAAEGARTALIPLIGVMGITKASLKESLEAAQRLSDAGFGNLSTSARRLTRILGDPKQAMTSLRSVGVSLSFSQRELVKDMLAVGQRGQAVTTILAALKEAHGGVNGAVDTAAGAYDSLLESTKIYFQQAGMQGGALEPVTDSLVILTNEVKRAFGKDAVGNVSSFGATVKAAMSGIASVLALVIRNVDLLAVVSLSLFAGSAAKAIILGVASLITGLKSLALAHRAAAAAAGTKAAVSLTAALGTLGMVVAAVAVGAYFMWNALSSKSKAQTALQDIGTSIKEINHLLLEGGDAAAAPFESKLKESQKQLAALNKEIAKKENRLTGFDSTPRNLQNKWLAKDRKDAFELAQGIASLTQKIAQLKSKFTDLGGGGNVTHIKTLTDGLEKVAKAVLNFESGAKAGRAFDTLLAFKKAYAAADSGDGSSGEAMELTLLAIVPAAKSGADALNILTVAQLNGREALKKLKVDQSAYNMTLAGGIGAADTIATKTAVYARLLKDGMISPLASVTNWMNHLTVSGHKNAAAIAKAVEAQQRAAIAVRDLNSVYSAIDTPLQQYQRRLKVIAKIQDLTAQQMAKASAIAAEPLTQERKQRELLALAVGKGNMLAKGGLAAQSKINLVSEQYSTLLANQLIPSYATMEDFLTLVVKGSEDLVAKYIELSTKARETTEATAAFKTALETVQTPTTAFAEQQRVLTLALDGTKVKTEAVAAAMQKNFDVFTGAVESLKAVNIATGEMNSLLTAGLGGQKAYNVELQIYEQLLAKGLIPKTATMADYMDNLGHSNEFAARALIKNTKASIAARSELALYKGLMEEIQTPFEKYNLRVAELNALLAKNPQLSKQVSLGILAAQRALAAADPGVKALTDSFATFTDGLGDMVKAGEYSFAAFGELVSNFVSDTMNKLLQLTVFKPLQDAFLGFATNIIGGAFTPSGGTAGLAPAPMPSPNFFGAPSQNAAHGAGFLNGVRMLAKGGLLDKPTLFNSNSGPTMGGEAGTEAVMPLKRTTSGDLGVMATGGGGGGNNVIVNVINNSDATATSERSSDGGGQETIDIIIDKVVAGLVKDPRSRTSSAFGRGFGATPTLRGR
tara:strand:+ start:39038 stop:43129 length:4092 start_codon:yes stop_codon:yes gene_type:complete